MGGDKRLMHQIPAQVVNNFGDSLHTQSCDQPSSQNLASIIGGRRMKATMIKITDRTISITTNTLRGQDTNNILPITTMVNLVIMRNICLRIFFILSLYFIFLINNNIRIR